MKTILVDTHSHTNTLGSDGEYPVAEQIEYAYRYAYELYRKSRNLPDDKHAREFFEKDVVIHWGITDHNTYGAFEELAKSNIKMPKNFILHTGVEFEAYDGDFVFDVTVHGIRRSFKESYLATHYVEEVVAKKNDLEDESAEIQYKAFLKLGLEIPELLNPELRYRKTGIRANDLAHDTMYALLYEDTEKKELLDLRQTDVAKRVTKYMNSHGYNPNMGRKSYYREFICNNKSPWYLDQTKGRLSLEEVAYHALHEGAMVLVSHPGIYDVSLEDFVHEKYEILMKVVKRLEKEGINVDRKYGFECGHRNMTEIDLEWVIRFCKDNNLVYAAESDFHKPTQDQKPFHICGGNVLIDAQKHVSNEWFNLPTFKEWKEDYDRN